MHVAEIERMNRELAALDLSGGSHRFRFPHR
jgi:hypothetical protein